MIAGLTYQEWIQVGISLGIILGTLLIGGRLMRWLLRSLLGRWTERTSSGLDDALLEALQLPLYLLILVVALQIALGRLDFIFFPHREALGSIFFILYLLIGTLSMMQLVRSLTTWYQQEIAHKTETQLDEQLMPFFRRLVQIIIVLIALIILLGHFEADVSALVTTLGVGSLAIALAAQETLSDTIAGFVVMVDRPYRVGDRIEIQDLNTWGDVVDIGLRSTRIRTRDNRMVIVPNSVIGKSLIVNHSYPDTQYRIQIHVGIAYGTDIEHARKTIIEAVRSVEGVLADHPVEALFLEFGDSALIFRVRWWLESYEDTRRMFDRVNTAIYNALRQEGIEIPFPQYEVHHHLSEGQVRVEVRPEPGE